MLTDQRTNPTVSVVAIIVGVLTLGYMLPWTIAACRGKSNHLAVGLLNFLLGWTIVGWIIALVMACTSHQAVAAPVYPQRQN